MMKSLAEKIREYRGQNNLTQEQFAEKIFVSRQAVSKWEQGRGYPSIGVLETISKLMGVSIDGLISNEENKKIVFETSGKIDSARKKMFWGYGVMSVIIFLLIAVIVTGIFLYQNMYFSFKNEYRALLFDGIALREYDGQSLVITDRAQLDEIFTEEIKAKYFEDYENYDTSSNYFSARYSHTNFNERMLVICFFTTGVYGIRFMINNIIVAGKTLKILFAGDPNQELVGMAFHNRCLIVEIDKLNVTSVVVVNNF